MQGIPESVNPGSHFQNQLNRATQPDYMNDNSLSNQPSSSQELRPMATQFRMRERERYLSAPGGQFVKQWSPYPAQQLPISSHYSMEHIGSPFSTSSVDLPSPVTPVNGFDLQQQNATYFWQYNAQGKQRPKPSSTTDPYSVNEEFKDPIFNSDEIEEPESQQLRHPGKARRGDGTDTTPNPTLLNSIGKLLSQLNNEIAAIQQPGTSLQEDKMDDFLGTPSKRLKHPSGGTDLGSVNRREKNMLASRVCRLKRKAQHEANKIIMSGLKEEFGNVIRSISSVEQMLHERILTGGLPSQPSFTQEFQQRITTNSGSGVSVAGRASEFVLGVLQKVENGDPTGGLSSRVAIGGDDDSESEMINALERPGRKRHRSSHSRLINPSMSSIS